MTSTRRQVGRAAVVLALAGSASGLAGGMALAGSGSLDSPTDPVPLPTVSPTPLPLPGEVTDPVLPTDTSDPNAQPTASDSPSPSPTATADGTDGGTATGSGTTGTTAGGSTDVGTSTGKTATTESAPAPTDVAKAAPKAGAAIDSPVNAASLPTVKAGQSSLGGRVATHGVPMTAAESAAVSARIGHVLALPDLPPLDFPALGSAAAPSAGQAPLLAPLAPAVGATTGTPTVGSPQLAQASDSSPADDRRSPVAPALFALAAAAMAAGLARVRISRTRMLQALTRRS